MEGDECDGGRWREMVRVEAREDRGDVEQVSERDAVEEAEVRRAEPLYMEGGRMHALSTWGDGAEVRRAEPLCAELEHEESWSDACT